MDSCEQIHKHYQTVNKIQILVFLARAKFMGFVNWIASKALGVPSTSELCEKNLVQLLLHNDISHHNLKDFCGEFDFCTGKKHLIATT